MTSRDPRDVALAERAAASAARANKRFAEWDRRGQSLEETPEFIRLANRVANLRPIRNQLAWALSRGERAYITSVNGVDVAFTRTGWYTQKMADAKIASQQRPAGATE